MSENQTPQTDVQSDTDSGVSVRNDMQTFVRAWETSNSVAEAAEKLGITKQSAGQRASNYRTKHGIPLKEMPRGGGSRINTDEANQLLAELRGVSVDEIQAEQAESTDTEQAETEQAEA